MSRIPRFPLTGALFLGLAIPAMAAAQLPGGAWSEFHHWDGAASLDLFGAAVATVDDLDGDSVADLLVGAPGASPNGLIEAGLVVLYSGATGAQLHEFQGLAAGDHFGVALADAGDVDGDGTRDLLIGAPTTFSPGNFRGSVFVYSGATFAQLHRIDGDLVTAQKLGDAVAGVGDMDGDGFDDFLAGAPLANSLAGTNSAGAALVYSGATGAELLRLEGPHAFDRFGGALTAIGDQDGDGVTDLMVGGAEESIVGFNRGTVWVRSGASGALLGRFDGLNGMLFGHALAAIPDLDGDGLQDALIGAFGSATSGMKSGSVFVLSPANDTILHAVHGEDVGDEFGYSVCTLGDVDGDGTPDFAVGAPRADSQGVETGAVYLCSGRTGERIRRLEFGGTDSRFGWAVAAPGDLDGDGIPEIAAGGWGAAPGGLANAGSAAVLQLDPYLHLDMPTLSVAGGATATLSLEFPASEAGARYAVLASLTGTGPISQGGLGIPLTRDALFRRLTSGNIPPMFVGAVGDLDANAQAQATLTATPALAPVIDRTIHFAAVSYDTQPLTGRVSSAVRFLQIVP